MMQPPADAVRVHHERIRTFVYEAAIKANLPEQHAVLLADWLMEQDLRGVFTHGSKGMERYVREIHKGIVNPRPNITVVKETPLSILIDGDHGLGYFAAYQATLAAIEKANTSGMAVMVTRNHQHIGAAGIYARMTLEHDLLTFVTSGVKLHLHPSSLMTAAAGGSPMAFSAPGLEEPPVILDCGLMNNVYEIYHKNRESIGELSGMILRLFGFGVFCQVLGGVLGGMSVNVDRSHEHPYNQGAMLFTFKISLFAEVNEFKREIDDYVRRVNAMKPLVGERAYLPGGLEAEHEVNYRRDGIPLSESHQQALQNVANDLGVKVPWE